MSGNKKYTYRKNKILVSVLVIIKIAVLFEFTVKANYMDFPAEPFRYADSRVNSPLTPTIEPVFTQEEINYIQDSGVIWVAAIDGAAPLSFADKNGEFQGVFKLVLDRISNLTGLVFECTVYNTAQEVYASNATMIHGITSSNKSADMAISKPFLKTKTILYHNSLVNPNTLENKLYAAIKDVPLPQGIKKENAVYYNTREESLNAVESGKAHYGYGNEFSVAYYILKNSYKNVITIPVSKEIREYCIGVTLNDKLLLSIINKAIDCISEDEIQYYILTVASKIEHKITLPMIMNSYGNEITLIALIIAAILLISVIFNVRTSNKLKKQNEKYVVLSQISNEYIYEYYVKEKRLKLSEKFSELFTTPESINQVKNILKQELSNNHMHMPESIMRLPMPNGETGVFNTINATLSNRRGKVDYIVGKLIDVSKDVAEKEELLLKSQTDGLTGLLNAITTEDLISKRLQSKKSNVTDALILVDCDSFKDINDTYGHLVGNQALVHVATNLKQYFTTTNILGRIGGDEFCVYLKDIPSAAFVRNTCQKLVNKIKKTDKRVNISVSIGIALSSNNESYEDLFKKADSALYQAKRKGKSSVVVYSE